MFHLLKELSIIFRQPCVQRKCRQMQGRRERGKCEVRVAVLEQVEQEEIKRKQQEEQMRRIIEEEERVGRIKEKEKQE